MKCTYSRCRLKKKSGILFLFTVGATKVWNSSYKGEALSFETGLSNYIVGRG